MIGSLLHLTISHPDNMFATNICVCFKENPKESYLLAVKHISDTYSINPIVGFGILMTLKLI